MRPPTSTEPEVGLMIPERSRSSVVFPEPLRPTRPTALPGATENEMSRSAQTSLPWMRPREKTTSFSVRCSRG